MTTYDLSEGDSPLILSMPHSGLELPPGQASTMTPRGVALVDTDWHIPRLYDVAPPGATVLRQRFSRYAVDCNRPPDGQSLYPGQATTELCPTTLFDGSQLFREGHEPTPETVAGRRDAYWRPYHEELAGQIARVKAAHGFVVLYDCHSIASRVPRLFEGPLPDLNLGTAKGQSCDPVVAKGVELWMADTGLSHVSNGRFVGGYITRHYGRPAEGVHAVQMEIGQDAYMGPGPEFAYDPGRAGRLRTALAEILRRLADWRPAA